MREKKERKGDPMKKMIIFYCLMLLIITGFGENYALTVGNNENDVYDMAECLESLGFDIRLLLNTEATGENILEELQEITKITDKNDIIILYYSGYGIPEDYLTLPATFDKLMIPLKKTKAKKILFLDMQFQNSSTKDLKRKIKTEQTNLQQIVADAEIDLIIAAGASEQAVFEGITLNKKKIKNNIATAIFIEGIKNKLADSNLDGIVTSGEIAAYYKTTREDISDNVSQKPEVAYLSYQDPLFTVRQTVERPQTETDFISEPDYSQETQDNLSYPDEVNVFRKDVTVVVDDLKTNSTAVSNFAVLARLNELLTQTDAVEVVDRENIGNIIEEKKLNDGTTRKVIESADYYISGNLYDEGQTVWLNLYLLDMSDSTKHLVKNIQYGTVEKEIFHDLILFFI
jgi:hypothetical protein